MYGWRAKIGMMIPSSNVTMEQEMWRMAPLGVSIHCSRMLGIGCNAEDLRQMDNYLEQCAEELNTIDPDAILYGCTSGSLLEGQEWERKIRQRLLLIAPNSAAVTTSGAVLAAMQAFQDKCKNKKITIINPYVDEVAKAESEYFENNGYKVVSEYHMGFRLGRDIYSQRPEYVYRLAKSTVTKETELLFISCTNLRTIEVIDAIEQDMGIPVITSNQASMWALLKAVDVSTKIVKNYGALFEQD